MCETLVYSAIQSQGRTEFWSALATYGDSGGGYAMHLSGHTPGYQPCGLEKHRYCNDKPQNHKSVRSS